jgi:teichuronic acid biosynthesis glycosyltransferase TuaC
MQADADRAAPPHGSGGARPSIVVLSTLFPSSTQPLAGVFIRERMFRVGRHLPLAVVSPQPWFPLQGLIRRWRPHYRPPKPRHETLDGVEVHAPRFLAFPFVGRRFDGWFVALAALPTVRRLKRSGRADLIDAHFGWPDGYAASLLGRWLRLPYTVTLRGSEDRQKSSRALRPRIARALVHAGRVIGVSEPLCALARELGAPADRTVVVGNGVDLTRFRPIDQTEARHRLSIPPGAPVIVSVGGLVRRKGFDRVIRCLPRLLAQHPGLILLIVGGPTAEGDCTADLRALARQLAPEGSVRFLGPLPHADLSVPLSAADVFVLATRHEGWANVFLEAMACGLPVVTTRVGGNAQVVRDDSLGHLVPYGDDEALAEAISRALARSWDRTHIRAYAAANSWDARIPLLLRVLRDAAARA